jgi:5-methylcytosine-specific restriction enzyme A
MGVRAGLLPSPPGPGCSRTAGPTLPSVAKSEQLAQALGPRGQRQLATVVGRSPNASMGAQHIGEERVDVLEEPTPRRCERVSGSACLRELLAHLGRARDRGLRSRSWVAAGHTGTLPRRRRLVLMRLRSDTLAGDEGPLWRGGAWSVCGVVGCPALVPPGSRTCPTCAELGATARRPTSSTDRRSAKWKRFAREYLRAHPRCCVCGRRAELVHHIDELSLDSPSSFELANLRPMCRSCHSRVHRERWKRG